MKRIAFLAPLILSACVSTAPSQQQVAQDLCASSAVVAALETAPAASGAMKTLDNAQALALTGCIAATLAVPASAPR